MPVSKLSALLLAAAMLWLPNEISAEASTPFTRESATEETERLLAQRQAGGDYVTLYSPFFPIDSSQDGYLFLMNAFGDPVEVEVRVTSASGDHYPIGSFTVEPTRHQQISLREHLPKSPDLKTAGSLLVRFFGDEDMLTAWAVNKTDATATEWELQTVEAHTHAFESFWNTQLQNERSQPAVYLLNTSPLPTEYFIVWGHGASEESREKRWLGSEQSERLVHPTPARRHQSGWVRVESLDTTNHLVMLGFLEGQSSRIALPRLDSTDSRAFESTPLTLPTGPESRVIATVFNPTTMRQNATLILRHALSGQELLRRELQLDPEASTPVDLKDLLSNAGIRSQTRIRVKVVGESRIVVQGFLSSAEGTREIEFFPVDRGHGSGRYPIPTLPGFRTTHTLVNLGSESANIVAQVFWDGGTHALPPIDLAPGSSHIVDFGELARKKRRDLLGRELDPNLPQGFFQWTSRLGSQQLIARLEVTKADNEAVSFGFNCFGCCTEFPFGGVEPDSLVFDIGQSRLFQAVEEISTCTGLLGPFPANVTNLNYSSPLSWNGVTISSSGPSSTDVSFSGVSERTTPTCNVVPSNIFGFGRPRVDQCQEDNNPDYDHEAEGGCHASQNSSSCETCYTCCEKQKDVAECRCGGVGQPNCTGAGNAACQTCKQQCFGHFAPLGLCDSQDLVCN